MKKCSYLALCLGVLLLLQALLVPKYMLVSREGALTGEYYTCQESHDVLLLGDCEVYENFSPITLWEEFGITSYIRGSAQQTIWQSYYLLEETFRIEHPKVVVFNVLALQYDTPESTGPSRKREAYNRMTLDTMRWSESKYQAIRASMTREETMLSYVFPLLRYHSRWSQLTGEDFAFLLRREPVSHNGYLMQLGVKGVEAAYVAPPRADYRFGENSWDYLERIRLLCREQGAQLVLIKAPSLYPVWFPQWEEQLRDYAGEHGLLYLNLLEAELGIDWSRDTYDAGLHLNVWGAEKASRYLGTILTQQCAVPDRRDDSQVAALWTIKAERYHLAKGDTT